MTLKHGILVVDDEPPIVELLARALTTYEDCFDVYTAASGANALELLERHEIAVVVTDLSMPGMDGFGLIQRASRLPRPPRFIVMTAHDSEAARSQAQRSGALLFLSKPFPLGDFIEKLLDALTPRSGFHASGLHVLHLGDVVQLLELSRASQVLELRTEFHGTGTVYVRDGHVVHATLQDLSGEAAFFEILAIDGGVIEARPLEESVEMTIERPLMELMMEAMRLKDEQREQRAKLRRELPPESSVVGGAVPEASGATTHPERFYRLVDEGFQAYRAGDLQGAKRLWESAAELVPDDRALRFNLRRLENKLRLETGE